MLSVDGTATLAGLLEVSLTGGFTPASGQQFTVLTADSVIDNGLSLGGPAASLFNMLVDGSSVILQAIAPDFNGDGTVAAADYVVWRDGLDTIYTQDHYKIWRAHFGQTAGRGSSTSANAAAPEPATLMLIILAAAGWSLRRRRAP